MEDALILSATAHMLAHLNILSGCHRVHCVESIALPIHLVPIILVHLECLQEEQSFLLRPIPTSCCCIGPEVTCEDRALWGY